MKEIWSVEFDIAYEGIYKYWLFENKPTVDDLKNLDGFENLEWIIIQGLLNDMQFKCSNGDVWRLIKVRMK
jgi:hypothetical protein